MGTTLGTAYVQIVPSAQGIKGSITNVLGGEVESAGKASGTSLGSSIVSFAKKAIVAGAIGKVIKTALDEGAKLQQSYFGGLDTLYGEAADAARAYADEASKAGISMNTYAEQAVSFGAALKQAFGGDVTKAAEAANTAILDMADNSAKMGTDIESVQMAYQGFAKQNYTMLDNLKLGYGGTRSEMQRLLADAEALTGVHYDIDNLGDVYEAIHVIQGELGLTGVAAQEASETFSGSFNAMKAAAENFLGNLALGQNVSASLNTLMESVSTFFFGNFLPMLGTLISSLPSAIITFVQTGIPILLSGITSLAQSLAVSIKSMADGLTSDKVSAWISTTLPKILSAAKQVISKFASGMLSALGTVVSALAKIGAEVIKGLGSALWDKVKAGAEKIAEMFMKPINALKEKVSSALEKVKSLFPISIGNVMSHLKLPHFSISGKFSLNPPSAPKFSISWYKRGGIIPDASVFGAIGMGEAGPEAILPLDPFWKKLDEVASNAQSGSEINIYINGSDKDPKQIAEEVKRVLIKETNNRRLAWQ